jgi:hypothetical protein
VKAMKHIILAASLVTGGVLLGRAAFSGADVQPSSQGDTITNQSQSRLERTLSPPEKPPTPCDVHDLDGLRQRMKYLGQPEAERREMERMPTLALKQLALQLVAKDGDPDHLDLDLGVRQPQLNSALAEIFSRDGMAALDWTASATAGDPRSPALEMILVTAATTHPEATLGWFKAYRNITGAPRGLEHTVTRATRQAAIIQGADALNRMTPQLETPFGSPFDFNYPDDFDFGKALGGEAGNADKYSLLTNWVVRDPDAAWAAAKGDLSSGTIGGYFPYLALAAIANKGEQKGAEWAARHLSDLPSVQRKLCFANASIFNKLTADGITTLISGLSPEDRREIAPGIIGTTRDSGKAIAVLDSLPREEMLEVLGEKYKERTQFLGAPTSSAVQNKTNQLYESIHRHFSITPDELAKLRGDAPKED